MSTNPDFIQQQVITYQDAGLAYLDNLNCFVPTLNTKFKTFEDRTSQLGSVVNLKLPSRYRAANGLVITVQPTEERFHPLSVMQAQNVAYGFNEQDFIYNARHFMEEFNMAAIEELSNSMEANVALNAISAVPEMSLNSQGQSVPTGNLKVENGPFRFYGDGLTQINSFGQLAEMESFYREYGAAFGAPNVYLPNMNISAIVNSGLNQFVNDRNEKMANSWDLGSYKGSNCRYLRSNLLPIHEAGNLGESQTTLTVVSINAAGDQLTLSGAGSADANAIKSGDLGQFLPGQNLNFLTFIGHTRSQCPVQFRVLADASSSGGNVTINITPPLVSAATANQNVNKAIADGATVKLLPSHRAGLLVGGKAFYLAMPQLGKKTPFITSNKVSTKTGVSFRNFFGSDLLGNSTVFANDCIYDTACLQDYSMRIAFPLT